MAAMREGPEPKPGDLIEIDRGHFEHWAVYVGDDYVVHLTGVGLGLFSSSVSSSVSSISIPVSGKSIRAVVKKELLTKVAKGTRYRVNNSYDLQHPPLRPEQIVERALKQVGQVKSYSLTRDNCEHFATYLRYGVARCDQVWKKAILAFVWVTNVILKKYNGEINSKFPKEM